MDRNAAETLAIKALGWLLSDEELLSVFMGSTGLSSSELKARAADPETLGAVLDFILMDDKWVTGFAAFAGVSADDPMRARAALPGGDMPHWT